MYLEKSSQLFRVSTLRKIICRRKKSYEKSSYPTQPMSKTEGPDKKIQLKPTRVRSNRKRNSRYYYQCCYPKVRVSRIPQIFYLMLYLVTWSFLALLYLFSARKLEAHAHGSAVGSSYIFTN
jgi:hypothetical protein